MVHNVMPQKAEIADHGGDFGFRPHAVDRTDQQRLLDVPESGSEKGSKATYASHNALRISGLNVTKYRS